MQLILKRFSHYIKDIKGAFRQDAARRGADWKITTKSDYPHHTAACLYASLWRHFNR